MQDTRECIIPPEALTDPKRRELLRAWVAHQNLHVSIFIPDDWGAKPAHWGIALTDIIRHLAAAYHRQHGIVPEETIRQIREMIDTRVCIADIWRHRRFCGVSYDDVAA